MAFVCSHCSGSHVSVECPTWPQFCSNCNEEHPFGWECYKAFRVVEDTSEIDARIAEEERIKAASVQAEVARKKLRNERAALRVARWRENNREKYNTYMQENWRRWK